MDNQSAPTALAVTQPQEITPMAMIQRAFESAIEGGAGLEVVDRILAHQREMMDYNDRTAFNAALRRIQDKLKPIVKDSTNPQTKSKYASAGAVDDAIEQLIADERMTLSFEPESHPEPSMIRIVGVLSLGAYSKRYPLDMPADGKGPQGAGVMSRTHATGSGISYGIRYLKRMIFNLRFKDDDGNKAGDQGQSLLSVGALEEWVSHIRASANRTELQSRYLEALAVAEKISDANAIKVFIGAKDARLKGLTA